jgi:hypothetical protein
MPSVFSAMKKRPALRIIASLLYRGWFALTSYD